MYIHEGELLFNFYQKQKTAMMATRIGFFTFFKLGWSNKVDSTPWKKYELCRLKTRLLC